MMNGYILIRCMKHHELQESHTLKAILVLQSQYKMFVSFTYYRKLSINEIVHLQHAPRIRFFRSIKLEATLLRERIRLVFIWCQLRKDPTDSELTFRLHQSPFN
ncbi:hypothetical protein AG1IA_03352 [Rhizoctonia solani AG-1 IA]|uniref:Uncharacterized protein n=1 Tax=Thanatephorus cucumeris (strain AG1-IA) TaxID=983506 RepID=L8X0S0_THACA|nr:hypothetical protein AG1IA_03352 [Rhizoctonia solani AG-1 IA]